MMTFRDLAMASTLSAAMLGLAGVAGAQEFHDFAQLDTDGDGTVTVAELEAVFEPVDAASVMELQDTNEDGVLSAEEAGSDRMVYSIQDDDETEAD